ncbi:hypothetical protein WG70_24910 [Burkholderia oklahomensis EO147]|nr:hypothetical protein WG70_24910 [Burkholderia oklahomensis EO147]KUY54553.1 hypothetical protein WG70_12725 [Burkholderia oklahomensis EO147]
MRKFVGIVPTTPLFARPIASTDIRVNTRVDDLLATVHRAIDKVEWKRSARFMRGNHMYATVHVVRHRHQFLAPPSSMPVE